MDKNCSTCSWNEDGLCDKKGILVNDTDRCKKWENYKKELINYAR